MYFKSNYTEEYRDGSTQRFKLQEQWTLIRNLGVQSKKPEDVSVHSCPNCGASIENVVASVCRSCGQSHQNGRFTWFVSDIKTIKEPLFEKSMIASSFNSLVDYGTQLPTIKDRLVLSRLNQVMPNPKDIEHLHTRVNHVFMQLQKAWSEQKWSTVRPLETDALFESHNYWMEEFRRKNQKNLIVNPTIQKLEPVVIYSDAFYLSYTVRVFASMIDYTVDQNGKLIRGHQKTPVRFSEYWTFIKGIGVNHKGAKTKDFDSCPSCGAQLKVAMSGQCEYCGTRITLGQFDWVLSQIEQDEEFLL